MWIHRLPAGLGTCYALACARVRRDVLIAVPAQPLRSEATAGMFLLNCQGMLVRRTRDAAKVSPFPAFLRIADEPHLAYWSGRDPNPALQLVSASDGQPLWRRSGFPWTGNGDFVERDLNGDGREEVIYSVGGPQHWISCADGRTGEEIWRYDDRVTICWGRAAVADIDRDGDEEIVFGTEYGNPDGSSSLIVLSSDGNLKWRYDSIHGDAGSTPTMLVDIDGDGSLEILKVEIDLCGRDGHISTVLCFDAWGNRRYSLKFGGSSMAVADIDGDGILEGLGLTTIRDGGRHNRSEMMCFDLERAALRWRSPVPRVYLSGDPVIANLSESEGLETLVTTGMPSGYGRIPGEEPWGQAYLFSPSGSLVWSQGFPDWAGDPISCDIDGDGLNEFVIPSYEGTVSAWKSKGLGECTEFPKANGGPLRLGRPLG